MVALPFRFNDQTRPYNSILSNAAQYHRVWMIDQIGTTRGIPSLARALITGSHFHLHWEMFYGTVGYFSWNKTTNNGLGRRSHILVNFADPSDRLFCS